MASTTTSAPQKLERHPIRGFFYGILFGLGLAFIAIGQKWAALGTWPPFIIFLVGIVIGIVWSTYGPAKKPKGPAPAASAPEPEPPLIDDEVPDPEPTTVEPHDDESPATPGFPVEERPDPT